MRRRSVYRGTRISIWRLERARQLGATEAELLESDPSLRVEDLSNAWTYVSGHPAEIEAQILVNVDEAVSEGEPVNAER